jgi:hypothetical protein
MADQGVFRALRASVFALVCVLLGAAGHALASGGLPPLVGVVTGVPLVIVLTGWFTARQRSFRMIAGTVTGAQLGLHAVFDYTAGIPARAHEQAHHLAAAAAHPAESITPAMVAAHLAAGLLAACWLRRGEAALWAHASAMAEAALPLFAFPDADPLVLPAAAPTPPAPVPALARPRDAQLRHSVVRRGPPRALLAH